MMDVIHVIKKAESRLVIGMKETIMVLMERISFLYFLQLFNAENLSIRVPCLLKLPIEKRCFNNGLIHNIQVHLVL